MNQLDSGSIRRSIRHATLLFSMALALGAGAVRASAKDAKADAPAATVEVRLSEWKVELVPPTIPAGNVKFHVTNVGQLPHSFEIEGHGIERSTPLLKPGADAVLAVTFTGDGSGAPQTYETYCPVGHGSHERKGMHHDFTVAAAAKAKAQHAGAETQMGQGHEDMEHGTMAMEHGTMAMEHGTMDADDAGYADGDDSGQPKSMRVVGGGAVIQILPGPFPFADSAMAVIQERPAGEKADLIKKAHLGPYSNRVAPIRGDISLLAVDRGAAGDSVSGTASFTTQDGARWRLAVDRVQTKDIPFNPRFGGVIMGLFYHGASGVHTPLVPTIQSSVALWAFAHLYRNDQLVTDNAMVHVMLLSRTRRQTDWALDCWDCSERPVEELQLQVTPPPGEAPFATPGGFLFVNWEGSSGQEGRVGSGERRSSAPSPGGPAAGQASAAAKPSRSAW